MSYVIYVAVIGIVGGLVKKLGLPWLLLLYIFAQGSLLHAGTPAKGCSCFMGHPSPRCCSFFVFEGGLKSRTGDSNYRPESKAYQLSYEFGLMLNHGSRYAYGGTFYWSGDDDGTRFALRARLRKWLTDNVALDYSVGPIFSASDNYVVMKTPGVAATFSFGRANWFSISATFEAVRIGSRPNFPDEVVTGDNTEWRSAFFIGGTLSHWPAIVSPIILIILIGATWE